MDADPAGKRYRMVALDIDGTLVDDDENATPGTIQALRRVVDAGVPVVVATGKAMYAAQSVIDRLGLRTGHGVASNGAVTFTYHPFRVTRTRTFDARPIVEAALLAVPDALVAVEAVGRGYRVNRCFPAGEIAGDMVVEPIERLLAEPTTRVLIRHPDARPHGFRDYAPDGVSKASALATLAGALGIRPQEVLAIGDGLNDLEMLRWAGRGVAMGHAPDELKAAADAVTGTLAAEGAAAELRRWF